MFLRESTRGFFFKSSNNIKKTNFSIMVTLDKELEQCVEEPEEVEEPTGETFEDVAEVGGDQAPALKDEDTERSLDTSPDYNPTKADLKKVQHGGAWAQDFNPIAWGKNAQEHAESSSSSTITVVPTGKEKEHSSFVAQKPGEMVPHLNSEELLEGKDFILETICKRLDSLETLTRENEALNLQNERLAQKVNEMEIRLSGSLKKLKEATESNIHRTKLAEEKIDTMMKDYLEAMKSFPTALEHAHKAVDSMMKKLVEHGIEVQPDINRIKATLTERGDIIHGLIENSSASLTKTKNKKLPLHLRNLGTNKK